MFCAIKAGKNTCEICYNDAFFSTTIPQKEHETLPCMHLFKCGHGVCETCFDALTSKSSFKCPFCRKGGAVVANLDYAVSLSLEARGLLNANETLPAPNKELNTFSEFIQDCRNNTALCSLNSKNTFMALHSHILSEDLKQKTIKKAKELKNIKLLKEKKEKEERDRSRKSAICNICNKNTFTSLKQLQCHIEAKHGNAKHGNAKHGNAKHGNASR